jgi:HEAT repeat protein
VKASIAEKLNVLNEAAAVPYDSAFIRQVYDFALQFSLSNADLLADDADMIALTKATVQGIGRIGDKDSAEILLKLCSLYNDSSTRVVILDALAIIAQGNGRVIADLNQLLLDQNNAFLLGMELDYQALQAGVAALGTLGDESSYPVLFFTFSLPYPDTVTEAARLALIQIRGNYMAFLAGIIQNNPPHDKLKAFILIMDTTKDAVQIPVTDKNILAQTALEMGLNTNDADSYALRYEAVRALTGLGWTGASALVIRHFYQVQTDYAHGNAAKERFIEAILCLGAMRTPESAQILAIQLGLINAQTEQTGDFDKDILLATIKALGDIGDKVAFDHLLYADFLSYSKEVKVAAKTALAKLKW